MTIELTANLVCGIGIALLLVTGISTVVGIECNWKSFLIPKIAGPITFILLFAAPVIQHKERQELQEQSIQENLTNEWLSIYNTISQNNDPVVNTAIVNKLLTTDMPQLSLTGLKLLVQKGLSNTSKIEPFITINPCENNQTDTNRY